MTLKYFLTKTKKNFKFRSQRQVSFFKTERGILLSPKLVFVQITYSSIILKFHCHRVNAHFVIFQREKEKKGKRHL